MNRFFLICPECYLEQELRRSFDDGTCFFVTALGSAFSILGDDFWSDIDDFIVREKIDCVYIVNDTSCSFVENAIAQKPVFNTKFNTKAEEFLIDLKKNNPIIDSFVELELKKLELCKLNLKSSARSWLDSSKQMRERLMQNKLVLEGLLFDRKKRSFTSVQII